MDSKLLEKRLSNIKDSTEDIQAVSKWCMQHKNHYHSIIQAWSRVIRKAKISHRLTLFYVCNEIVQNSRRKKATEFIQHFATAIKEAAPLVRDEKIRGKILRIFIIWEERSIYDSKLLKEFREIIEKVGTAHATENDFVLATFQPVQLVEGMRNILALEKTTDNHFKDYKNQDTPLSDSEVNKLRLSVKERSASRGRMEEFDDAILSYECYWASFQKEVEERTKLITLLEQAEIFYETQRGEAKLVVNAYKNFSNRLYAVQKKTEEKIKVLPEPSPVPSPPVDAESPYHSDEEIMILENSLGSKSFLDSNPISQKEIAFNGNEALSDLKELANNKHEKSSNSSVSASVLEEKVNVKDNNRHPNTNANIVQDKLNEKDNNFKIQNNKLSNCQKASYSENTAKDRKNLIDEKKQITFLEEIMLPGEAKTKRDKEKERKRLVSDSSEDFDLKDIFSNKKFRHDSGSKEGKEIRPMNAAELLDTYGKSFQGSKDHITLPLSSSTVPPPPPPLPSSILPQVPPPPLPASGGSYVTGVSLSVPPPTTVPNTVNNTLPPPPIPLPSLTLSQPSLSSPPFSHSYFPLPVPPPVTKLIPPPSFSVPPPPPPPLSKPQSLLPTTPDVPPPSHWKQEQPSPQWNLTEQIKYGLPPPPPPPPPPVPPALAVVTESKKDDVSISENWNVNEYNTEWEDCDYEGPAYEDQDDRNWGEPPGNDELKSFQKSSTQHDILKLKDSASDFTLDVNTSIGNLKEVVTTKVVDEKIEKDNLDSDYRCYDYRSLSQVQEMNPNSLSNKHAKKNYSKNLNKGDGVSDSDMDISGSGSESEDKHSPNNKNKKADRKVISDTLATNENSFTNINFDTEKINSLLKSIQSASSMLSDTPTPASNGCTSASLSDSNLCIDKSNVSVIEDSLSNIKQNKDVESLSLVDLDESRKNDSSDRKWYSDFVTTDVNVSDYHDKSIDDENKHVVTVSEFIEKERHKLELQKPNDTSDPNVQTISSLVSSTFNSGPRDYFRSGLRDYSNSGLKHYSDSDQRDYSNYRYSDEWHNGGRGHDNSNWRDNSRRGSYHHRANYHSRQIPRGGWEHRRHVGWEPRRPYRGRGGYRW